MSERNYLLAMEDILLNGKRSGDRTGTGTIRIPGVTLEFDVSKKSFPAITSKKLAFNSMMIELLWLLRGNTNIKWLQDRKCRIWNEWADDNGDLGPVYGKQWRDWGGIDQIKNVINGIKTNPNGRRHIVSAWNVEEIENMALPPCHSFFQFTVIDGEINLHLTQRSGDMFLGVPFNIASYSLLLLLVAGECKLKPGKFFHTINDAHIYENHIDQVKEQLARTVFRTPEIYIDDSIYEGGLLDFIDCQSDNLSYEELKDKIKLVNYVCGSTIKADVSI